MEQEKLIEKKNDKEDLNKPVFKFKEEEVKSLKTRFEKYFDEEGKIGKKEFKIIMSQSFQSLKQISDLIFDAIIKSEPDSLDFDELVGFFEELLNKEKSKNLNFSFRLLTKNKKDTFNRDDLKLFLIEIEKLNTHDHDYEMENQDFNFFMEIEDNNGSEQQDLDELTEFLFMEFSMNGKYEEIEYDRFSEVLENNELIFIIFNSLSGGLTDLILLKKSDKYLKEFIEDIYAVEGQIENYFVKNNLKLENEESLKKASSMSKENPYEMCKSPTIAIKRGLKRFNSIVSKSKASVYFHSPRMISPLLK